jgi:shikimate dehydrogenase
MKKYFVIGNPIDHSQSPKLHNYWLKENSIDAIYDKKKLDVNEIKNIISEIRDGEIDGINITVPFKKTVIPFLDQLTPLANSTQSVNTVYKENNKITGHNTDVGGFELSLKNINYQVKNKKIFILGAGGVVSSIIFALRKMGASKITLSNRTRKKAEDIKKIFPDTEVISWGEITNFDMITNATSLGLKKNDEIKIDYQSLGKNKLFYDVIYNPQQTNFLLKAKEFGNQIENGKMMFIYQAHQAFAIWHKTEANIDEKTIELLDS